MAASHFQTNIYGLVEGNPPFQTDAGITAFSRDKIYPKSQSQTSFSVTGCVVHPLANGYLVANTQGRFYMYSIVEILPTGLNKHSTKYLSNDSAATIATDAG